MSAADLKRPAGKRAVVIDCWRMLDRDALSQVADYLGIGTADVSTAAARIEVATRRKAA